MEITDKEVVKLLINSYRTDKDLDALKVKIKESEEELKEVVDSLTLSAQRITGMPKATDTSSPIENIMEEYIKIQTVYSSKVSELRQELEQLASRQHSLHMWIRQAELDDVEMQVLDMMYKYGYKAWKIGEILAYEKRNIWRIRGRAVNKLSRTAI